MSINNGMHAEDPDFPTTSNYSYVDETVIGTNDGPMHCTHGRTTYGATFQAVPNESLWNNTDAGNQFNGNNFYDGAESLLNQKLILEKEIKSPVEIRYKTHYFPQSGKNAGRPQTPRYLHTVDDQQEIVIKFPNGYIPPPNPDNYWFEVVLLTVPIANQYYKHVNKFQLHHTDVNIIDENPFFIRSTPEHFEKGEIRFKLVLIKTHKNELKNIVSLSLFGDQTGKIADCKSVEDLKETYKLNHSMIAFSLGYLNMNGEFIRFPSTTVISNELIERESKSADDVTCPNCSHTFSVKEQKDKGRKRSASLSNLPEKKCSSQQ